MLIYVIPSSYPNAYNPQACIFVKEQLAALSKLGHEIVVLDSGVYTIKKWKDISCWKIVQEQDDFSTIYRYHVPMALRSVFTRTGQLLCSMHVKKLFNIAVKQFGIPDVIYTHFSYPTGMISAELSNKYKIPLVVEEHGGMYFEENLKNYYKTVLKTTMGYATEFIAVSEALAKRLVEISGIKRKISVIPNLIDERFCYKEKVNKNKMVFFAAASLYDAKRFDLLMESFNKSFGDDSAVELRIGGNGPEKQHLLNLIEDRQCKNIFLLGQLSRDEMLREYTYCDAFVLLSEHESFGIVYREAMAVGRPVITTANQGMKESWDDSMGIMVPIDDEKAAIDALKTMRENIADYDGKALSELVLSKYSSTSIARQVSEVLKRAFNN